MLAKKHLAFFPFLFFTVANCAVWHNARAFDFQYDMPQFQYGIHYKWNLGQWVEDSRFTPFYSNGQLDSLAADAYVNSTYVPYQRASLLYASGLVSMIRISIFDGTSWSGLQVDSFTYSGNRILYQDRMVYQNGVLQTHNLFTHSYNGSGVRTERLEEDLVPGPRRNDDDWLYSYDAQGRIDTIYDNDWNGSQWVYKAREVYYYGSGGELDTVDREYYSSGAWSRGEIFVVVGAIVPGETHLTAPSSLAFDTLAGTSQTKSLTLTNSGTAPLALPTLMLKNGSVFSLSDTSGGSIAAGSSATISLTFSPPHSGLFYDTLVIGPTDAPLALVYLSGIGEMGRIEITKDTTALQAVVGSSDTGYVTITNHGEVQLMLTMARVLNSPNDFSVEALGDPLEIGAGQSVNLSVYYSPTASSPVSSSATVDMSYSDGGNHPDTTFVLEGNVVTSGVANSETASTVTISPNPSNDRILIDGMEGIKEIDILDAAGREVLSQKISDQREAIDVSALSSGSYSTVLLHTNGNREVQRLTIIH